MEAPVDGAQVGADRALAQVELPGDRGDPLAGDEPLEHFAVAHGQVGQLGEQADAVDQWRGGRDQAARLDLLPDLAQARFELGDPAGERDGVECGVVGVGAGATGSAVPATRASRTTRGRSGARTR